MSCMCALSLRPASVPSQARGTQVAVPHRREALARPVVLPTYAPGDPDPDLLAA